MTTVPRELPSALSDPALADRVASHGPVVFLDYDGVLSPIVERPEDAVLDPATKEALIRLATRVPVAIVSGRDLADVRGMVDVDGLVYAGSHGWDVEGLDAQVEARGEEYLESLHAAEHDLYERVAGIEGAWVERKRYAIAVHFRQVDDGDVPRLERVVREVADGHADLRVTGGKRIFELRPDLEWNKGTAVTWLFEQLDLHDDVVPIYIGDDETDEDAFRALADRGVGIIVQPETPQTAASHMLADTGQVVEFLELLSRVADDRGPT